MKLTNKIIAAIAAVLFLSVSVYAQEIDEEEDEVVEQKVEDRSSTFSFTNTLSSNIFDENRVKDVNDDDPFGYGENSFRFSGIREGVDFEFNSNRVDAGARLTFELGSQKRIPEDDHLYYFGWVADDMRDFDYYVEFRPFSILTLGYHDNIYMYGSLLPILGKNVEGGNLGSNGFSVIVRPIVGLRLSLSIPFDPAGLINPINDDNNPFTFGFGVDYTYNDFFSIGVGVQDIIDMEGITISGYGLIRPTKARDLTVRAGFTHTQNESRLAVDRINNRREKGAAVFGQNLYNASIEYKPGALSLAAEILGNLAFDKSLYDLYIGYLFGYKFGDHLGIEVTQKMLFDLDKDLKTGNDVLVDLLPKFIYTYKKHEFSAGVDLEFIGANMFLCFPVAWKYTL